MIIEECIACGNCVDFIEKGYCPADAIFLSGNKYKTAKIDQDKCIDCGLCLKEIDCLGEAIIK